jgi:integrase
MAPRQLDNRRDGISIEDRWKARGERIGKHWMAKVRDPRAGAYKRKAFEDHKVAMGWAKRLRASFELGQAGAGSWLLSHVKEDILDTLEREGRTKDYIRLVERCADDLAAVGVTDLADDHLHAKVRRCLDLPIVATRMRTDSDKPSGNTIRRRYACVRALVSHAMMRMGMRHDPLVGFELPAKGRPSNISKSGEPETYSLDEVRAVLASGNGNNPIWLSFALAVYAGLRAQEIRQLRWQDIDWTARLLRIAKGKGSKVRVVTMQEELYDLLNALGGPGCTKPRLGSVVEGIKIPRLTVHVHLRPLLEGAGVAWDRGTNDVSGLPRRLGWHSGRRAHAAAFLAAGGDGLELQRNLGHTDSDLTGHYSAAFAQWRHQVAEEKWPRGRLCFHAVPGQPTLNKLPHVK